MLSADLYFSFRSPYSYLAIGKYRQIAGAYDLTINLRPVYPIAIRDPGFFERESPLWLPYLIRDIRRVAEYNDLPLALPQPDPIVMNLQTREIAAEQPLIRPITYLGVEAARQGRGVEFADEVSSMIWGGVENWNSDENMTAACERAGLVLSDLQSAVDGNAAGYEAEIAANDAALEKSGHWGVPTLVFQDEPFFGQDRIDIALWRMKQAGLLAKAAATAIKSPYARL